jgi:formylglycine-generating enzyme required for sulfatase activity
VSSGIHLLCIGISRYRHAPLTSGAVSAFRVYQTFAALAATGNIRLPLKSAELVVDPDPIESELVARLAPGDAELFTRKTRSATRSELDRVFNDWFEVVRSAPDDIAVLYFAGHGLGLDERPGDESKTLLLASDFDDKDFRRVPRAITLEHLLSGLQPASYLDGVARYQLYLLDCCRTRGWDGPPAEQGELVIEMANRRSLDASTPDDRHVAVQYACCAGDQAFTEDNALGNDALVATHFAESLIATLERLRNLPELRVEYLLKHVAATLEQRYPAQQARRGRFNDFPLRALDPERPPKPIAVVARHSEANGAAATVLADHTVTGHGGRTVDRALGFELAKSSERGWDAPLLTPSSQASPAPHVATGPWRRLTIAAALVALAGTAAVAFAGGRVHRPAATPPPGMIFLPGGSFQAGSAPLDAERAYRDCLDYAVAHGWAGRKELPCSVPFPRSWFARETRIFESSVTLRPFFIDRTEVTNRAFLAWLNENKHRLVAINDGNTPRLAFDMGEPFAAVRISSPVPDVKLELNAGAYRSEERDAERPVANVTWLGADAYCRARGKRLPSEIEWEYAARGSPRRRTPWGDAAPDCGRVAFGRLDWQECKAEVAEPSPVVAEPSLVGSSEQDRTPEGVSDLGGNLAEWTSDVYLSAPGESACVAARGHACRVVRGGAFGDVGFMVRSAFRSRLDESSNGTNVGFRCAKDAQ